MLPRSKWMIAPAPVAISSTTDLPGTSSVTPAQARQRPNAPGDVLPDMVADATFVHASGITQAISRPSAGGGVLAVPARRNAGRQHRVRRHRAHPAVDALRGTQALAESRR